MRRWLHALGWVWKRAKRIAKDNQPCRAERLARIRWAWEHLQPWETLVFAEELDIHLLPKVGAMWRPKGTQVTVMTPGQNAKHYLAGALEVTTGTLWPCLGTRKTNALFRELLVLLEERYPAPQYRRLYVVVDNCAIHKAKAVGQWLASHPRIQLLFLPPIVPGPTRLSGRLGMYMINAPGITRVHTWKSWSVMLSSTASTMGPGAMRLSHLYHEPEVTTAMEALAAEALYQAAA